MSQSGPSANILNVPNSESVIRFSNIKHFKIFEKSINKYINLIICGLV